MSHSEASTCPVRNYAWVGHVAAVCVLLVAFVSTSTFARGVLPPNPLRPAALTGTDGPLGPQLGAGVVFTQFQVSNLDPFEHATAAINSTGQSLFMATISGPGIDATNDRGIWVERNGGIDLVVRVGDHAPGTDPGVVFSGFVRQPNIADSGAIAFRGVVSGPGITSANDDGAWLEDAGTLSLILQENTTPLPNGTGFYGNLLHPDVMWFITQDILINDGGHVALGVFVTDPPPDPTTGAVTHGTYSTQSGTLEAIVRSGTPVPGFEPRLFASAARSTFSTTGNIAFTTITTTPFPQYTGIWSSRGGTLLPVALAGDPAPGTNQVYNGLWGYVPDSNASDRVAFVGGISGGEGFDQGIFSEGFFGIVQPIAFTGAPAPGAPIGTEGTFFSFDNPALADDGTTAFTATINRFGLNRGIWSNRLGTLGLVALAGDIAPGGGAGAFTGFTGLALNGSGFVSFFATTSAGKAFNRQNPDGTLDTVVSTFTTMDLFGDKSDIRLITDITAVQEVYVGDAQATSTSDGRRTYFNDAGDISFRIAFAGGSEGIMTTALTQSAPCPADLTGDGLLNFFDVSAFLSAFSASDPVADFTGDGQFNFFDVSAFLSAFSAGCP